MSQFNANRILTDDAFAEQIGSITQGLLSRRVSGYFTAYDGRKLYYEAFPAGQSAPSVVIVHGLSEFTAKYYELIHYLLEQNYGVFIYDQRGHGLSERLTPDRDLLHVNEFEDYVLDLDTFIEEVVRPHSAGPLYCYAHSMGCAVTVLYMHRYPDRISKAALAAPMFQPCVGNVPFSVAKAAIGLRALLSGKESSFNAARQFNPEVAMATTQEPSRKRFMHNLTLRINEPMYQTTPLSLGWVRESLKLHRLFRKNRIPEGISVPTLLISADQDRVVKNTAQYDFARRCPACRLERIADSAHSLLTAGEEAMTRCLTLIFDFFAESKG